MLSEEEQKQLPGWPKDHMGHIWSGWPGAMCLRCGAEHALENALALGWVDGRPDTNELIWDTEEHRLEVLACDNTCAADVK